MFGICGIMEPEKEGEKMTRRLETWAGESEMTRIARTAAGELWADADGQVWRQTAEGPAWYGDLLYVNRMMRAGKLREKDMEPGAWHLIAQERRRLA